MKTDIKIYVGICLDFETGGLDCQECACTQIALEAIRLDTWEVLERYTAYIAPYHRLDTGMQRKVLRSRREQVEESRMELMKYEEVALNYSAISIELLVSQGMDIKKVAIAVVDFVSRNTLNKGKAFQPILIGQNIPFDIGFLQQMMNYSGLVSEFEKVFAGAKDYYGNFQPHYIDTIHVGRLAFAHDPEVVSYKLELMASRLGVELDDAHDAGADVAATVGVMGVYTSRLRNGSSSGMIVQKKDKMRNYFKI